MIEHDRNLTLRHYHFENVGQSKAKLHAGKYIIYPRHVWYFGRYLDYYTYIFGNYEIIFFSLLYTYCTMITTTTTYNIMYAHLYQNIKYRQKCIILRVQ